jgi:hypothetical protein
MTGLSPVVKLAASVLIGVVSYAILILTIDRESVAEARALLRSRGGRAEAVPEAAAEAAPEAPVATPAAQTAERLAPVQRTARSTPQRPPALGGAPARTDTE